MGANPLPYQDDKPLGAADFYFAINATFRFIEKKLGPAGLQNYWTGLGANYFAPVSARWRAGGLPAVAEYWRAFFAAEPGADVAVSLSPEAVTLEVKTCPAIRHLRAHRREIVPCFCQHCYFVGEAMAASAGLAMELAGGNGQCTQRFIPRDARRSAQNLAAIQEATSC